MQAALRQWSGQLDLVAGTGTDLDAAAMFWALEEAAPRAEVEAAVRLLDELLPPGDDEAEAEVRRALASRYSTFGRSCRCSGSPRRSGPLRPAGGCWRR
ncbi:hypothetical protein SGLAM104S_06514 [Streptomyces glaucescens]